MDVEKSMPSSSGRKEISVMEFVECRARELNAMMNSVSAPLSGGNRTPMQTLPRHMRRRAANHDIRRLPLNRRLAAQKEMEGRAAVKRRPPSRRHRRRPCNLVTEYARRKRKHVWLETHIWHAKRFHMAEMWSYKLPNFRNDRGVRAAYRDSVNHCALMDLSYFCCIEVTGKLEYLLSCLARVTSSETGPTIGCKSCSDGSREGRAILYSTDSYPRRALGEVTYMWHPVSATECETDIQRTLWIWTHPSCHDVIFSELKGLFNLTDADCKTFPIADCEDIETSCKRSLSDCNTAVGEIEQKNVGPTHSVKRQFDSDSADFSAQKKQKLIHGTSILAEPVEDLFKDVDNKTVNCNVVQSELHVTSMVGCAVVKSKELGESSAKSVVTSIGDADQSDRNMKKVGVSDGSGAKKVGKNSKKKRSTKESEGLPHMLSKVLLQRQVYDNSVVRLESLKDDLCRFRLIGPSSHRIIAEALQPVDADKVLSEVVSQDVTAGCNSARVPWWKLYYSDTSKQNELRSQLSDWDLLLKVQNAAELPVHSIISLVVRDPRLFLPDKKSSVSDVSSECCNITTFGATSSQSPFWDRSVRDAVKLSKLSTDRLNKMRSKYLVPGTVPEFGVDDDCMIPVLLVQRPSLFGTISQSNNYIAGSSSYCSGWDIVLPVNWSMPFWVALIYRGARAAGLREVKSLAMESGLLSFPDSCPDTAACADVSKSRALEQLASYLRRPPAKRCSFAKLGIASPFHCPWAKLINEWSESDTAEKSDDSFYCVRNRKLLLKFSEVLRINRRKESSAVGLDNLLSELSTATRSVVQVRITMTTRGVPGQNAIICIPGESCLPKENAANRHKKAKQCLVAPVEPIHKNKNSAKELGEIMLNPEGVVNYASRRTIGYVVEGGFSHSFGRGVGVGFVACRGLVELVRTNYQLERNCARVLVRATTSSHYHVAEVSIVV